MKGYFSRIASQSGHRFSGENVPAPGRSTGRRTTPAAPSRQETVLVAPSVPTKNVDEPVVDGSRKEGRSPRENSAASHEKEESAAPGPEPDPSASGAKTVQPPVRKAALPTVRKETNAPESVGFESVKQPEPSKENLKTPSREITKTVFVEPPGATEIFPAEVDRESRFVSTGELREVSKPDPDIGPSTDEKETGTSHKKEYFAKTAGIIARDDVEPEEAQTIVLREIQEWVAAGNIPEPAEDLSTEESRAYVEPEREDSETFQVHEDKMREPGVVRIVENRSNESREEKRSGVEEQAFDLSIGSISVVIEGDEKPTRPQAAQNTDDRKSNRDSGSSSSRLRRSYI